MVLFRTPLIPNNEPLPSKVVGVCQVLAPGVDHFLNSVKKGYPCWRSLVLSLQLTFLLSDSSTPFCLVKDEGKEFHRPALHV